MSTRGTFFVITVVSSPSCRLPGLPSPLTYRLHFLLEITLLPALPPCTSSRAQVEPMCTKRWELLEVVMVQTGDTFNSDRS